MKHYVASATLGVVLTWGTSAFAFQGEQPLSYNLPTAELKAGTELVLPAVDVQKSLAENLKEKWGTAQRFAIPHDLKVSPASHGAWQTVSGGRMWRLTVVAAGATDLNFGFNSFVLPEGAHVHLVPSDASRKAWFMGPYTAAHATASNALWTAPVPDERVTIELFVPGDQQHLVQLDLARVSAGFRDVWKLNGGYGIASKQGACNNDVVCPVGDGWRDQIRSVAAYTVGGIDACTGTLVNDADTTFTNHFITAFHCGVNDQPTADTVVTIWNYESPMCGDLGNGSRADTVSGATYRASRSTTDMAIWELPAIPESYNVHYSGWDRSGIAGMGSVGIHHPGVDEKAISFDDDPPTKVDNCITADTDLTHWQVTAWDDGTTERGSSGSGLFNQDNGLLIGFLSGGRAACAIGEEDNDLEDCYGSVDVSWTGGGSDDADLQPWLDPNETSGNTVTGTDPVGFTLGIDPLTARICTGTATVDFDLDVGSSGGFNENVMFSINNLTTGLTQMFSDNPVTPPGTSTLTIGNLNGLAAGAYDFTLESDAMTQSRTDDLAIIIDGTVPEAVVLIGPDDLATDVSTTVMFSWDGAAGAVAYALEIATDAGFTNIITMIDTDQTSATVQLDPNTTYYWRVRASNACGDSADSDVRSFTTAIEYCFMAGAAIPDGDANGITITTTIEDFGGVLGMTVLAQMTHTYMGDIIMSLSKDGTTTVTLMDQPGVPAISQFGCSGNNMDVVFDDAAPDPVETSCTPGVTDDAITGLVAPEQPLAGFDGADLTGDWELFVSDNASQDTGTIGRVCLVPQIDLLFGDGFGLGDVR